MAEEKRSEAILNRIPGSNDTYYVKVDPVADTYSVVKANQTQFQNNEGDVIYQVKNASSLTDYGVVPEDNRGAGFNTELIKNNGGNLLLQRANRQAITALQKSRADFLANPNPEAGDPTQTLPPLKPDTLLGSGTQFIAEGLSDSLGDLIGAFKGQGRSIPNAITPNSNTRLIGGGTVLKYPIDMDTRNQDYLQIGIYSYKPGRLPGITEGTPQGRFARQEKAREVIQIPIPNAIRDQNAVNWGPGNMTSTSGEAANAVAGALFSDTGEANANAAADILGTGADLIGSLGKAGLTALKTKFIRRRFAANKLAGALSGLGVNIDVGQAITRLGGVIENPNLELLFTGPSLRTFQFSVRFTPRSADESVRVRQIIRALKERSAVKKGVAFGGFNEVGDNLLLGTPDVFRLEYKRRGSIGTGPGNNVKGLNKFKTCALTNISVDYTGEAGRWAAYDGDSQPITTIVTLSFSELVPLYDTDYRSDSSFDDDVAF